MNAVGILVELTEYVPGAAKEDYWECEAKNKDKPNFVRDSALPKLDISKVGEPRREALFEGITYKSLDRVAVKIYDVEKSSTWQKILTKGLDTFFGPALNLVKAGTAFTVGNLLTELKKQGKDEDRSTIEKKFSDLMNYLLKEGHTRLIWEHSTDIEGVKSGDSFAVSGNSQKGIFTATFKIRLK
ncbi:MAG: hypothetical protein QM785_09765 [Pyrinomonadaceae bacterium]